MLIKKKNTMFAGLVICLSFLESSVIGQAVDEFSPKFAELQSELLAKLTGNQSINVKTNIGNEKRVLSRMSEVKLTDRSSVLARKASANLLYEYLRNIGLKPKRHRYKTKSEGTNIYAIIPATEKSEEFVLLGAHYDLVKGSPGANDNASGTALVFGVAHDLAMLKVHTRNFIIIFFDQFDQEEQGLIGSRAFAAKLKNDGINLHSAHTGEQMGWDADRDRAIELELRLPSLRNCIAKKPKNSRSPFIKPMFHRQITRFSRIRFKRKWDYRRIQKRRYPALSQANGYLRNNRSGIFSFNSRINIECNETVG